MPFFRYKCKKNKLFKQCNVTLQVRNPLCNNRKKTAGIRVSFSLSCPQKGSMTVEAALGLTMFLLFMALMAFPLRIMDTRRQVQAGVEAVGEKAARYAYIAAGLVETDEKILLEDLSEEAVCLMAERAAKDSAGTDRAENFSAGRSRIMRDGETIDLIVDYRIRLPFPVFRLEGIPQQVRCFRRAWTGKTGLGAKGGEKEGEKAIIVYLGRDGSRYHLSRTCHYLYNDMAAVSRSKAEKMRNRDGKRYRPCAVCGEEGGETVYVMPSGESYHSRRDCRAVSAYVRAVPLKEAEYLGACSYCSQER